MLQERQTNDKATFMDATLRDKKDELWKLKFMELIAIFRALIDDDAGIVDRVSQLIDIVSKTFTP